MTGTPTEARAARIGTILLVEDDDSVREATALFLRLDDHDVICAATAEEALDLLPTLTRGPDLIVTDFKLSLAITGADLVEQIRALTGKHIPCIVISGDALRAERRCSALRDCIVFQKPVNAEELVYHAGRMLASSADGSDCV